MSFLTRWFKKGQPEDYEQVLASLSLDIQKRQTRLSEIRLRERRTTLLFSVWALAFWAAYVGLWYANLLPNLSGHGRNSSFEKVAKGVPVFVGPIVILFIRRIVQIWYTRIGDAEEKALVSLRKQQRQKVEEVKKKTNYYSMRNLIERYDDSPSAAGPAGMDSPLRKRNVPVTPQRGPVIPPQTPEPKGPKAPQTPAQPNAANGIQQQFIPSPPRPMAPPRKQWYDKLADAILGDDDSSSASASASRYALICGKCFAHNGLVKESMWEDAQYVCPKCGHFNPSQRSIRAARQGQSQAASPRSPQEPAMQPLPQVFPEASNAHASEGVRRRSEGEQRAGDVVKEVPMELDL